VKVGLIVTVGVSVDVGVIVEVKVIVCVGVIVFELINVDVSVADGCGFTGVTFSVFF
jgi:hypothetical protein